ncbi:unnamed protein product [Hermetia illucens]|uniref:DUF4806 domain-containing protein n=1 Tax=Hermetia illucens TaxID=343691 RepID=A0A7R8YWE9_HERIL|nr:uncharacterized protein LOC119655996 [Hermetia illucens]CAD7087274.1 unnamed protein product [Hermetia illucens]
MSTAKENCPPSPGKVRRCNAAFGEELFSQYNQNTCECIHLKMQLKKLEEKIVKQNQAIMDVLASHSVLLNKIYKNETMPTEVSTVFPIKTVEELEKLNNGISEEDIPFYVATVKMKIKAGGLIKNFSKLISEDICLKYNYNGTHGKLPFCQYLKINGTFEGAIGDENYTSLIKQAFKRAKNKITIFWRTFAAPEFFQLAFSWS